MASDNIDQKIDAAREATDLVQELTDEVYFSFNFTTVLADASQAERDVVRLLIDRAKLSRNSGTRIPVAKKGA